MNVFISCGEPSGDVYAAALVTRILERRPGTRAWGMMGPKCEAASGDVSELPRWSYRELGIMGVRDALAALPRLLRLRRAMVRAILEARPSLVVLVDSPDYHLPLAASLRRAGWAGRLVSLVPPTVWAWRSGRVEPLKAHFDLCLPLFSFEHDHLVAHGARSAWTAHPLVHELGGYVVPGDLAARVAGERIVAVMPGSRAREVRTHLSDFLGAAEILKGEGLRPVLSVAPGLPTDAAEELRARAPARGIDLWEGEGRALMAASEAVLGVSGTVAVEAMLLRRFMTVVYKVAPLTHLLLRSLVHVPYISIPDLLVDAPPMPWGTPLYPELIGRAACPARMADAVLRYLGDDATREEISRRLEAAVSLMGTGDAASFWADRSLEGLI